MKIISSKKLRLIFVTSALLLAFSSCKQRNEQPVVQEISLQLIIGKDTTLTMDQISPGFSSTSLSPDVARVELGSGKLLVSGLRLGFTEIKLKDAKDRERFILKVRVARSYQLFKMARYLNSITVGDTLIRRLIDAEMKTDLPYPLNGYYGFDMRASELYLFPAGLTGPEVKGRIVALNASGEVKLIYNNEEHTYLFSPTLPKPGSASTSELNDVAPKEYGLIEDMTVAFQSRYPKADVRRVYRIQLLIPED